MVSHQSIDGGNAWITVISSGILHAIVQCNVVAYGLLLIEFSEVFKISKALAGWPGSLYMAFTDLCGIGMGLLVHRYGCRPVAIICALITGVSLFLTGFSTSIYMIYVTFAIAGIGSSGMFLTSIVSVQQRFVKKRSIAMGIALSIASVAVFIFMPCYRYLIMYYGWRGALFIHAGFSLQGLVAGAMILPIPAFYKTQKHTQLALEVKADIELEEKGVVDERNKCRHESVVTCAVEPIKPQPVVPGYKMLLTDKDFWLFMISRSLTLSSAIVMYQQSSSRAVFKGMNKMEAALLPAGIGIGATLSRFTIGFIANMPCTNRTVLLTLSTFGAGIVVAGSCLPGHFYGSFVFTILSGCCFGSVYVTTVTVMVDLFGAPAAPKAHGLLQTAAGFLGLIALPFTGFLFDMTGNYDIPFLVVAAALGVAAMSVLAIFITNRPRTRR